MLPFCVINGRWHFDCWLNCIWPNFYDRFVFNMCYQTFYLLFSKKKECDVCRYFIIFLHLKLFINISGDKTVLILKNVCWQFYCIRVVLILICRWNTMQTLVHYIYRLKTKVTITYILCGRVATSVATVQFILPLPRDMGMYTTIFA